MPSAGSKTKNTLDVRARMKKPPIQTADLVARIEQMTKERMAEQQVISLKDVRDLSQTPHTLLIIEDDETIRRALVRIFEDEDYLVLSAADGTQLTKVLDRTPIDLILLDIGLPWVNGYELAELMKAHKDLKHIPLIFVSGRTSEEDMKRAFAVGADDYIKKPFDVEKIKKTVRTLIRLNHG
jgi:two-component system aerobic respiration control protein ArcA